MRRRILLGEDGVFTVSPTASTVACNASSLSVTLYWNGAVLKADGVTYDFDTTEGVSSVSYNKNTGIATVNYRNNESLSDPRQMTVTFTYKNQNASILITQQPNSIKISDWDRNILLHESGVTAAYARIIYADGYSYYTGEGVSVSTSDSWMTCSWNSTNHYIVITPTTNNGSQNRAGTVNVNVTVDGVQYLNSSIKVYQYKVGYHESLPQMEGVPYIKNGGYFWSIKNIGASDVVYHGNLYQWGAGTTTYECGVKQCDDTDGNIPSSADTATQVLGSKWRTPTKQEFLSSWSNYDCGRYFTPNTSSNGIIDFDSTTKDLMFLPYVYGKEHYTDGCPAIDVKDETYWCREAKDITAAYTYSLRLGSTTYSVSKRYGLAVRGVFPTIKLSPSATTVNTFAGGTTFNVLFDDVVYDGNITITSSDNWVSATNNNGTITVTYQQNSSGGKRDATITVTALGQTATFTLTQQYIRVITSLPYDGENGGMKYLTVEGINFAIQNLIYSNPDWGIRGENFQWGAINTTCGEDIWTEGSNESYTLPSSRDVATQQLGRDWRIPTKAELTTLKDAFNRRVSYGVDNAYYVPNPSTPTNYIEGIVVYSTSDPNRYLFFPQTGHRYANCGQGSASSILIWSSNPQNSVYAYFFGFSGGESNVSTIERTCGLRVRPVYDPIIWNLSTTQAGTTSSCAVFTSGSTSIKINGSTYTGTDYTVSVTNGSWVTTARTQGTITFTAATNTTNVSRTATINVTFNGETKTCTISQGPASTTILPVLFADGNIYQIGNWPSNGIPIAIQITGLTNTFMAFENIMKTTNYYWGGYGYDVPNLTNCSTESAALSDMDGKSNTAKILAVDNSQSTAWQTASTINNVSNNQYVHPLAQACWRYYTAGTSKGDWYLPSAGEWYEAINEPIQCTLEALTEWKYGSAGEMFSIMMQFSNNYNVFTSTEYDSNKVWDDDLFCDSSMCNSSKSSYPGWCRPFLHL